MLYALPAFDTVVRNNMEYANQISMSNQNVRMDPDKKCKKRYWIIGHLIHNATASTRQLLSNYFVYCVPRMRPCVTRRTHDVAACRLVLASLRRQVTSRGALRPSPVRRTVITHRRHSLVLHCCRFADRFTSRSSFRQMTRRRGLATWQPLCDSLTS